MEQSASLSHASRSETLQKSLQEENVSAHHIAREVSKSSRSQPLKPSLQEDSHSVQHLVSEASKPSLGFFGGSDKKAVAKALALIRSSSAAIPEDWDTKTPWLDAHGKQVWADWRMRVHKTVTATWFQNTMLAIIFFNLFLIIYETDQEAECYPKYKDSWSDCPTIMRKIPWLHITNLALLVIYSLEVILVMFVFRARYFFKKENWLDFGVCVVGWTSEIMGGLIQSVSWLRILRATRILRHPWVKRIHELNMLVMGFSGSMKAMAFGVLLILAGLVFSSIILVQYVHPTNVEIDYGDCERCSRGYETVFASTLTLFQQIIAGDSWGLLSIPNIENDWRGAILLPIVNFFIGLGVMNLILAVIVECAVDARIMREEDVLRLRLEEQKTRKESLVLLFQEIDVDHNGVLEFEEVQAAYRRSDDFKKMMLHAGLQKDDLRDVFEYLDSDMSGAIEYMEFCDAFEDVTQRDAKVLAALAKINIQTLSRKVEARLDEVMQFLKRIDRKLGGSGEVARSSESTSSESKLIRSSDSSRTEAEVVQLLKTISEEGEHTPINNGYQHATGECKEKSPLQPGVGNSHKNAALADLACTGDVFQRLYDLETNITKQFEDQRTWMKTVGVPGIMQPLPEGGKPNRNSLPLTPARNKQRDCRSPHGMTKLLKSSRCSGLAPPPPILDDAITTPRDVPAAKSEGDPSLQ